MNNINSHNQRIISTIGVVGALTSIPLILASLVHFSGHHLALAHPQIGTISEGFFGFLGLSATVWCALAAFLKKRDEEFLKELRKDQEREKLIEQAPKHYTPYINPYDMRRPVPYIKKMTASKEEWGCFVEKELGTSTYEKLQVWGGLLRTEAEHPKRELPTKVEEQKIDDSFIVYQVGRDPRLYLAKETLLVCGGKTSYKITGKFVEYLNRLKEQGYFEGKVPHKLIVQLKESMQLKESILSLTFAPGHKQWTLALDDPT